MINYESIHYCMDTRFAIFLETGINGSMPHRISGLPSNGIRSYQPIVYFDHFCLMLLFSAATKLLSLGIIHYFVSEKTS